MTDTTHHRRHDAHTDDETTPPRDVALSLTDSRVLIYDARNHRAWIVSTASVALTDVV
jgi:hypothetical protein